MAPSYIRNGDTVFVAGTGFELQSADHPWNLTRPDPSTYRFELRPGDVWDHDPSSSERSELASDYYRAIDPNEVTLVTYQFMIEPGARNTAEGMEGDGSWLVVGQFHPVNEVTGPAMSIEMVGERMAIRIGYDEPDASFQDPTYQYVFMDDTPIVRGRYYEMRIEVTFDAGGNGFLRVWQDKAEIVDYTGPLGFDDGEHAKFGIYRSAADETIAVDYRHIEMQFQWRGATINGTRKADTIGGGSSPKGQPKVSDDGDFILGRQGNDVIRAGSGEDHIHGGSGRDLIRGGGAADVIEGERGNDQVRGGRGRDVFQFDEDSGRDVIRDFRPGFDRIELLEGQAWTFASVQSAAHVTPRGVTIVASDTDIIVIKGVTLSDLSEHDFLFT